MVITSIVTEEPTTLRLTSPQEQHVPPHATTTSGRVVPIVHPKLSGVDFGAEIYGIDLNNFSDADFDFISDALHKHKLLVFKEQPQMLTPQQQYALTSRQASMILFLNRVVTHYELALILRKLLAALRTGMTPSLFTTTASTFTGYQSVLPFRTSHKYIFSAVDLCLKDTSDFHPVLRFKALTMKSSTFRRISRPKSAKQVRRAFTNGTSMVHSVKTPKGPDVTVRWEDEAGTEMKMAPGATAMVAGSRALALLDDETRQIVANSRIEYAPHAFVWMSTAHSTRLGHLLENEGLEKPLDELPKWDKSKVCTYPMVWTNPKTGEKSLQVHGQGAFKLYLKSSRDGHETVVDDLKEVRAFMDK
ncbi:hypothetical protein N0V95_009327 [Ascochyta clinopodiicola]|nr:hypothetical protein N0V95_009327 [Ascochyta clinopodiicola]